MQVANGEKTLKEQERTRLAADVADFLRRGGTIKQMRHTGMEQDIVTRSAYRPMRVDSDLGI